MLHFCKCERMSEGLYQVKWWFLGVDHEGNHRKITNIILLNYWHHLRIMKSLSTPSLKDSICQKVVANFVFKMLLQTNYWMHFLFTIKIAKHSF